MVDAVDPFLSDEILDWWSAERAQLVRRTEEGAERLREMVSERVDALSRRDLFWPGAAHKELREDLEAEVEALVEDLSNHLRESSNQSIETVEGAGALSSIDIVSAATLVASGAMAAGAVGAAVMAGSLATTVTTTSILGFFATGTIVTFSWPVFVAVGTGATLLAIASPQVASLAVERLRERQRGKLLEWVDDVIIGSPRQKSGSDSSVRARILALADAVRDIRLKELRCLL